MKLRQENADSSFLAQHEVLSCHLHITLTDNRGSYNFCFIWST